MLVTASFVRHPFHRLVSAYRDKIGRRCTRFFTPIRKMIVETYRKPLALIKSYISKSSLRWSKKLPIHQKKNRKMVKFQKLFFLRSTDKRMASLPFSIRVCPVFARWNSENGRCFECQSSFRCSVHSVSILFSALWHCWLSRIVQQRHQDNLRKCKPFGTLRRRCSWKQARKQRNHTRRACNRIFLKNTQSSQLENFQVLWAWLRPFRVRQRRCSQIRWGWPGSWANVTIFCPKNCEEYVYFILSTCFKIVINYIQPQYNKLA